MAALERLVSQKAVVYIRYLVGFSKIVLILLYCVFSKKPHDWAQIKHSLPFDANW